MKKSAAAALLGAVALTMLGGVAHAATGSGMIAVGANLVAACSMTGTGISFGTINPTTVSNPVNAAGTLTVRCTNTTPYSITLDGGTHQGSSATARNMQNSSAAHDSLPYQVYLDTARTAIWGGASAAANGVGSGTDQMVNVFAQIPNVATMVPGVYSDTLMLTITY